MKNQSSATPRLGILFAIVVTMVVSATPVFAQNANPNNNPNQIAILRWYQANTAPTTFSMGGGHATTNPIASDGENIWVASTDGFLAEFSTDGKLLFGPFALPSGTYPVGMAFDGVNIWITDFNNNRVHKFNVNSHTIVATYPVGNSPYFIAFDGANMWIVNNGDATVGAYKASNGTLVGAAHSTLGASPTGVAFDGKCIWVANTDTNNVAVIDAATTSGSCPSTLAGNSFPTGQLQPFSIAYDGKNMWVGYRGAAGGGPGGVVELSGTTGAVLGTFGCTTSTGTGGLAFDGAYIWEGGGTSGICKFKSSQLTGTLGLIKRYTITTSYGVAFDGTNIWTSIGGSSVAKF